ncbi:MAG: TRAP transporter small permease [Haliea sp.]|nr:MAG: TRAP transporter small permease [Haliea sp.]
MKRAVDALMRAIEYVILAALVTMVVLVFSNVLMRYVFNSGIAIAEEVSRYCFVWLVFLGAVVAMREHAHLGMDSFVRRLPPAGQKACLVLSHLLMLWACAVFFLGSWNHMLLGRANHAPVTGIPLSWINASGVVCSAAIAVILVADLVRLAAGRLGEDELVQVAEEQG